MKSIILLFILSNSIFGQAYGPLEPNQGADHGIAKNYSWLENNGIPIVPNFRSEIEIIQKKYYYIRTSKEDFKISRKEGNRIVDVIPKMKVDYSERGMNEYSRLLNIYEDNKLVNIYSWGVSGYNFLFYQKRSNQSPRLIRFGCIRNTMHSTMAFDKSIQSIDFDGSSQMKITTVPAVEDGTKGYYDFKRPGVYEFRADGVYLNGVFDPSVADYEPKDVVDENLRNDPQYYQKRQELHAARVASYTKELMDAEAARVAALPPKPMIKPTTPEIQPTPITKTPDLPKPIVVAVVAEPIVTRNLNTWLSGLVALLAMLLGYLGWRYFGKKAKP